MKLWQKKSRKMWYILSSVRIKCSVMWTRNVATTQEKRSSNERMEKVNLKEMRDEQPMKRE